jgi:hypothetical protein
MEWNALLVLESRMEPSCMLCSARLCLSMEFLASDSKNCWICIVILVRHPVRSTGVVKRTMPAILPDLIRMHQ